jgi:hypothetical protein
MSDGGGSMPLPDLELLFPPQGPNALRVSLKFDFEVTAVHCSPNMGKGLGRQGTPDG